MFANFFKKPHQMNAHESLQENSENPPDNIASSHYPVMNFYNEEVSKINSGLRNTERSESNGQDFNDKVIGK